jgi:cadmium resistance protein CadD (predicted permease)
LQFGDSETLTIAGIVASAFVATNLDNLLIMVVLLGANVQRRAAVLLGYLLSALSILCVSIVGVALGTLINPGFIGYLGFVPLTLGLYMLYKTLNGKTPSDTDVEPLISKSEPTIWLATFILMFSNSGDSVAVFLPLLAESGRSSMVIILLTYVVMIILWGGLSYLISGQRDLALRIERSAEKIVPWVMIGVGTYILMDTATDTLL